MDRQLGLRTSSPAMFPPYHPPKEKPYGEKSVGGGEPTIPSPNPILELNKAGHAHYTFSLFLFFPCPSLGGFSQRLQSYVCHLFLTTSISELIRGPRTELMEKMVHSPIPLPAFLKKKQTERMKRMSYASVMNLLADGDKNLCRAFEHLLHSSFQLLYSFLWLSTNCHMFRGLKQQKCIFILLWRIEM